jgi:DNA-binding transcriptional regulator YiaG
VDGRDLALIAETRRALADGSAKRRRIASGIRQVEMAVVLHVVQSTVSQWETGRRVPDATCALAYGKALAAAERRAA